MKSVNLFCKMVFNCPVRWEELKHIENESKKRFCSNCDNIVYLTTSYQELQENASKGRCIATFSQSNEEEYPDIVGYSMPDSSAQGNNTDPILFSPINTLDLPKPMIDRLRASRISFLGDLARLSTNELLSIFSFEKEEQNSILQQLAERGLTQGMIIPNWEFDRKNLED
ncbi:hypothetical protein [Hydrogenophaga sp. OTU3427]|uniref:hypothetical protein n=1 Tax=Hydrogenophaga sp. OTU3427 TaxID=3043856 RepID=UPI00313CC38E